MPDAESVKLLAKRLEIQTKMNITDFYVVKEETKPIGIGGISKHKGTSFIGYMGVDPSKRKQGIGSKLFDKLVKVAIEYYPTIELFANIGADRIYRKYGFVDQFRAYKIELSLPDKFNVRYDFQESKKVPNWVFAFDKEAIGYDRSSLLKFLVDDEDSCIVTLEEKGKECYAIKTGSILGPMIAKTDEIALQLIGYMLKLKAQQLTVPESILPKIEENFPYVKQHECIKMIYGEPIKDRSEWIWSYNSFAHG
ncbi:MAG: GNAT family N-acetyltransferase [Candidatus Heimdallarchaeota archaeon]